MSQTGSRSKNVITPSSLTLSTGPNRLAAIAAVVRAPSMTPPARARSTAGAAGWRRRRAAAPADRRPSRRRARRAPPARSDRDRSTIGPSSRCSRSRRDGAAGAWPARGMRDVEAIGRRHERRDARRVAHHHEQRAFARVGQVERRLEQPHRQRVVADGLRPQRYFACRSSRCHAAPRNVKTSAPSAKTLISRDGLSTAQTCPCCSVARACG